MKQRDFYSRVMGLEIADEDIEGRGMVFLSAHPDEEHHEFVIMKGRTGDESAQVIQQLSFKVDSLAELKEFHTVFKNEGVEIYSALSATATPSECTRATPKATPSKFTTRPDSQSRSPTATRWTSIRFRRGPDGHCPGGYSNFVKFDLECPDAQLEIAHSYRGG